MNIPAAILGGALIIGASIALTSHWNLAGFGANAVLLNRWTGEVAWCGSERFEGPARLDCTPK